MKKLETPTSSASKPGLVRLLVDFPANVPSPAALTSQAAARLSIEVADFLNAREQTDVPLGDVTPQWLHDFVDYLTIFYSPTMVQQCADGIQLVKAHYEAKDTAGNSPLLVQPSVKD